MSTERQEKGKYLAYYQQVRKRGRNRGEIQIRENVLFRDSVRDWYTGLFSKRTLGNSELQDKLDKSGAHLSKVGGLLCRVGGASATLDPVQALDPISAPLCQHRTAPGGVGKQDWLNLRAEIAVTGFAHDPLWSAKTSASRNLHDSWCRFRLLPAIVPTNSGRRSCFVRS